MNDTTTETGTELALFPKLNLPSVTGTATSICEEDVKSVLTAIYKGQVPHVSISY